MFARLKARYAEKRSRKLIQRFIDMLKARDIESELHGLMRQCANPFHRHVILFVQPLMPAGEEPQLYHLQASWDGKMYLIVRHEGATIDTVMEHSTGLMMQVPRKELTQILDHEADRLQFIWIASMA